MKSHWNRHMLTLYRRSFDSFQVKNVQYPGTGLIIWFGIRLVSCKARNTPIPGASKNTTYFKWRASMLQHYHHIGTRGNRTNVSYIPLGININVTLALKTSYSTTVSHRKEIEKILQPTWSKHQTKYNNHLRMAHSSTFCTMYVYWCPSRAADTNIGIQNTSTITVVCNTCWWLEVASRNSQVMKTCNCTKPLPVLRASRGTTQNIPIGFLTMRVQKQSRRCQHRRTEQKFDATVNYTLQD